MNSEELQDALWDAMASLGYVDARGGAEYLRLRDSLQMTNLLSAAAAVVALANGPA